MPRKPAEQPRLAVPKIEGQPYHPDPDVMARLEQLDATDPLPQPGTTANLRAVFDGAQESTDGFYAHPTPVKESDLGGNLYGDDDHTTNPYLLESATILADLANEASRAQRTIAQLDAEMAHLAEDADFQIRRITARRDAEVASRQARVDDLMKIVSANTIVNGEKQESGE